VDLAEETKAQAASGVLVAVYGWGVEHEHFDALVQFFQALRECGWGMQLYEPMARSLASHFGYVPEWALLFSSAAELKPEVRFMVSIGGDGTFLDSMQYVCGRDVPIVGVNFGHLGFLAAGQNMEVHRMVMQLYQGSYEVEERTTLQANLHREGSSASMVALNDVTLQKSGKSMLVINAHIDGHFLCSYWCDGLIVSTPTGSTAYSLSVGGPLIVPTAQTLLVSPIAPHNLSMRPLVLADSSVLHLRATSRDPEIVLGADAKVFKESSPLEVTVSKSAYRVKLVRLQREDFYSALREKLKWGMDVRN